MEETEKMIDKIKKVMALATGGSTEAERDTAMLQAQKLLDKYNLSMSDIEDKKDKKFVGGDEEMRVSPKNSLMENLVSSIIEEYYNVQIIIFTGEDDFGYRKRDLKIFGQKHNVEVAKYMHPWLMGEFDQRWNEYKSENGLKGTKYKDTFTYGLAAGLKEKLKEQREALIKEHSGSTDLAILDESTEIMNWIKSTMDIKHSKGGKVDIKDFNIMDAGIKEGRNINLNEQVK